MSFLCMGRCGVSRKRKAVASHKTRRDYPVSAPRRMVGEVGGLVFDRQCCASAVVVFRVAQRVPVPCVLECDT